MEVNSRRCPSPASPPFGALCYCWFWGPGFSFSHVPSFIFCLPHSSPKVLGMVFITLLFSLFGVFTPSNRGAIALSLLGFFFLMGLVGGYVTARIYKTFNGTDVRKMTASIGFFFFFFFFEAFLNFLVVFSSPTSQHWRTLSSSFPSFSHSTSFCMLTGSLFPSVLFLFSHSHPL